MADDNEDQWLYGDSIDEKPDFPGDDDDQNELEESGEIIDDEKVVIDTNVAQDIPEMPPGVST